ncbi:TPA: P22AR C-terminal domain-containing protein [Salmonella enterica subsp. enterica serovar Muenchen]
MATQLTFKNHVLETVEHDGKIWFTAATLAIALEYSRTDSVTRIYDRNQDEFTSEMTTTTKLTVVRKTGSVLMDNRLFTPRGAHLVAMFASTPVAKEFRRWLLDLIEEEMKRQQVQIQLPPANKPLLHTITLTDDELCDVCWLWKISENMQKAAKKIYPGLLELGSEHTGVCRDAAYESVPTINRVRKALLRITSQVEFAPELSPNWRRILPQLRQI